MLINRILSIAMGVWIGCGDRVPEAVSSEHAVVFAVLDTVRADRTSLCGHARPTTPTLDAMGAKGASWTCRAYAPGGWTLPSHASFFTGRAVTEHGVWRHADGQRPRRGAWPARPLSDQLPTLAEGLAARGYQTVLVSGNPILVEGTGLQRGFRQVVLAEAADGAGSLRGEALTSALADALAGLDPDHGPVAVVLNIFDAHDTYPAVPDGVAWAPPTTPPAFKPRDAKGPYRAFVDGTMTQERADTFLRRVRDTYDFGVSSADQTLGRALEVLEQQGWTEGGLRLVVTSDHGEFLGEEQRLRHGAWADEVHLRVPLLYWSSSGESVVLPEPVSATVAFYLARDGQLPPSMPEVASAVSAPWTEPEAGPAAAIWRGSEKWRWHRGEVQRFDVVADPREQAGQVVSTHPMGAWMTQIEHLRGMPLTDDALDVTEAMEALGYVGEE